MSLSNWSRLGQIAVGQRDYWQWEPLPTADLPIFYRIIRKIKELIPIYLNQTYGFSQDYGSVDEFDPGGRQYPAIFFEYLEEEDIGDEYGVEGRFSEETDVSMRIWAATGTDLDIIANRITADIGRFFEMFRNTLKDNGLISWDYLGTDFGYRAMKNYPVEVVVRGRFKYRRVMDSIYAVDSTGDTTTITASAWVSSTPVFNAIKAQIIAKIALMTVANGYSQNYGSVDNYDPATRAYPAVFLSFPAEMGFDDDVIDRYQVSTEIIFRVISTETNVDLTMYRLRSDFNKMFAANLTAFQAVGMHHYEYLRSRSAYTTINAYPMEIFLHYLIGHRRQKSSPYLT